MYSDRNTSTAHCQRLQVCWVTMHPLLNINIKRHKQNRLTYAFV